jgi:membrane protein DedA with SNARE-associated domain
MIERWVTWARDLPEAWGWFLLLLGSIGEAVAPPIPGDALVVAGGILMLLHGEPIQLVWLVATLAGGIGAAAGWKLGDFIRARSYLHRLPPELQSAIARALTTFRTYGIPALIVNRFVPGLRAVAFVACGVSGMRLAQVCFWSTLSAGFWNAALLGLAWAFHENLPELEATLDTYRTRLAIVVVALVAVGALVWRLRAAQRPSAPPVE